jgi:hypothetical protein
MLWRKMEADAVIGIAPQGSPHFLLLDASE